MDPLPLLYWRGHSLSTISRTALRVDFIREQDQCPCPLLPPEQEFTEFKDRRLSSTRYDLVESLVLAGGEEDREVVNHFPNLHLLSILFFDPDRILSIYSELFSNLTHMQVPPIYRYGEGSFPELTFWCVHTLQMDFSGLSLCRKNGETNRARIGRDAVLDCLTWKLPSLVNIGFSGVVTKFSSRGSDDIEEILKKFGQALQGFSLTNDPAEPAGSLPYDLWRLCPNLRVVHTHLANLTSASRPPSNCSPLRLIISELGDKDYWKRNLEILRSYYHGMPLFIFLASSWGINLFEMDIGWSTLQQQLKEFDDQQLKTIYSLFVHMEREWPAFRDRYGEDMNSESAKELMVWLRGEVETSYLSIYNRFPRYRRSGYVEFDDKTFLETDTEAEFTDGEAESDSSSGDDESGESIDYDYFWWDNDYVFQRNLNLVSDEDDENDEDYQPESDS
ncbi:hypothetical protein CPB86DRAFT_872462 [Serendipita vermifera]|nr:hypothetical protein CPB86DRAFT_872462 [Serendipita vermifera]